MNWSVVYLAVLLPACATIREYLIVPFTCDYEGGINISNGRLLHLEEVTVSAARPNLFDDRKAVKISGEYYSLESFQPVLMCIDPELSVSIPKMSDDANPEILRRYALISLAVTTAPLLPVAFGSAALAVVLSSSSAAGIVGYIHGKFFEPNVDALKGLSQDYNRKLAEHVRKDDRKLRFAGPIAPDQH